MTKLWIVVESQYEETRHSENGLENIVCKNVFLVRKKIKVRRYRRGVKEKE